MLQWTLKTLREEQPARLSKTAKGEDNFPALQLWPYFGFESGAWSESGPAPFSR